MHGQSVELATRTHVSHGFTRWRDILGARPLYLGEDRPIPSILCLWWEVGGGSWLCVCAYLLSSCTLGWFSSLPCYFTLSTLCSSYMTNPTIFSFSILVVDLNVWSILALTHQVALWLEFAGLIFLIKAENQFQVSISNIGSRNTSVTGFFVCIHLNWAINLSLWFIFIYYYIKGLEIKWFMVLPSATAYARPQSYDLLSYVYICQYKC